MEMNTSFFDMLFSQFDVIIVFKVGLTIIIAIVVYKILSQLIHTAARRVRMQKEIITIIINLIKISIVGLAFISILGIMKIDVTGLVAGVGIGALAIGFAAQTLISNLISGLFLFFEGVFKLDDYLRVGDVVGKVVTMSFRTTQLETMDGNIVTIPNSILASSQLINLTGGSKEITLTIEEVIDIYADYEKAKELMLEALQEVDGVILTSRHKPIILLARDPSQWRIILTLHVLVKASSWYLIQSDITESIKKKFDANGLIPPVPAMARDRLQTIKDDLKNLEN